MITKTYLTTFLLIVFISLGCTKGQNPVDPPINDPVDPPINNPVQEYGDVSGTVYAPNGLDPISGALVYVEDRSAEAVGTPPTEDNLGYDYSEADGSFEITDIPVGDQTIVINKGAFTKVFTMDVQEGQNAAGQEETTLPSESGDGNTVEKMAVVTGMFDNIEDVLAKLGLGSVDASGSLILGTETFTLIDGNGSLDDATYMDFDDFITDSANYADYRTIFINCGNNNEGPFFANVAAKESLNAWVMDGGRLYATDQAYDFVEQLFPEFVDYYGGGAGLSTAPEPLNAAEAGTSFMETDATILDTDMLNWLQAIGATNPDGTVKIEGWLSAWAAMDALASSTSSWAQAPVEVMGSNSVRDITISFEKGSGTIFYSSYHTEDFLSSSLTPQDRILEYLIFEIL